jgi:hypothetical protein
MHAGLTSALFRKSLAIVLIVTVPVIRTLIGRGWWHAMCTSTTTEPALQSTDRPWSGDGAARHRASLASRRRRVPCALARQRLGGGGVFGEVAVDGSDGH